MRSKFRGVHFVPYGVIKDNFKLAIMKTKVTVVLCFFSTLIFAQSEMVKEGIYRWADHPVKYTENRESRVILSGASPHFEYLGIHASTQLKGAPPSTLHANEDIEELIIVKEGEAKITFDDKSKILKTGGVVLLLPQQLHSIENVGDGNLTYYVMRYRSKKPMQIERGLSNGGSMRLDPADLELVPNERGGRYPYFDRPTAMCERIEMHSTQLNKKGPSHAPHKHIETEIILMISGQTEITIDDKEYSGIDGDFYFINSGSTHGVRNPTGEPCYYFAFKWR